MKLLFYIAVATLPINSSRLGNLPYGIYSYETERYSEKIELRENNTFDYSISNEFIRYRIQGNFNFRGDSLILDSSPQKDKIIVRESKQGRNNITKIIVTNKMGDNFHYSLIITERNNNKDSLIGQWGTAIIKNKKIKSFSILDSKGLRSPEYFRAGSTSNYFIVQFESTRIFENEGWLIKGNTLCPKGLDGNLQNYFLTRKLR